MTPKLKLSIMEVLYKAKATSRGGRGGNVKSADGILNLELRPPKEMGGEEGYNNPEQLFAAGYAACFDSAMEFMARRHKLDVSDADLIVEIGIGRDPSGEGYRLEADITGVFPKGITDAQAEQLMNEAHGFCPYSRAVKGNIDVRLHHTIKS